VGIAGLIWPEVQTVSIFTVLKIRYSSSLPAVPEQLVLDEERNPMQTLVSQPSSWEAYIVRKIQAGQDPTWFSPEELWEFNYLVDLIQTAKPHLDQITVILAVREGMRRTMAPRMRGHFIDLVMENIQERESQWALLMENIGQGVQVNESNNHYPYIAN